MLPSKDDDRRDKAGKWECSVGVGATSLKQPEKLLNCQRSVRPRREVGGRVARVNPLMCLTLCGVSRFGWQKAERRKRKTRKKGTSGRKAGWHVAGLR